MNESHEPIIHVDQVSKSYGKTRALHRVSFTVRAGERLGLLGPNGAGKSTCLKLMAGLIRAQSGSLSVAGHDLGRSPLKVKSAIGYLPEEPRFFPYLTGREHLRLSHSLRRIPPKATSEREARLIERLRLEEVMDRALAAYSHGMRQKLAFLLALYHDPPALLIDEPMVGLDVAAQTTVKDLIREASRAGKAVLISTHTLALVEEIATEIVILDRGHLIEHDSLENIMAEKGLEAFFLNLAATETGES